MPSQHVEPRLHHEATLYLHLAHRGDDFLSDAELSAITELLWHRHSSIDRSEVQATLMDALAEYAGAPDGSSLSSVAASWLCDVLSPAEKERVLGDLTRVAGADGVVMDAEHDVLEALAQTWGLAVPSVAYDTDAGDGSTDAGRWDLYHDLAYVYLALAHGTDNELSKEELLVMRQKLREWRPDLSERQARSVIDEAMARYAQGPDEETFQAAVESIRVSMMTKDRLAALNDLVQIANADGVFLDDEEDLLNRLLVAWEVDPVVRAGDTADE